MEEYSLNTGLSDTSGAFIFKEYLDMIKKPGIRTLTSLVLDRIGRDNKYFFQAPASSSGKYHPECSRVKPGGLVRHTIRAVEIGKQLSRAMDFSETQTDIVLASLILHDIWKNKYQTHASSAGVEINETIKANPSLIQQAKPEEYAEIIKCVTYHMGPWTEKAHRKHMGDYTLTQLVVYLSDYLSSRPEIGTLKDDCSLELVKAFLIKGN